MKDLMLRAVRWVHDRTAWAVQPAKKKKAPLCRTEETTRLMPSARVCNCLKDPDRIRVGGHTVIRGELLTFGHGGDIQIGSHCYVGEGTRIWSACAIHIGDRTLISHNVNIFDSDTHPIDDAEARHKQFVEILTTGFPKSIELNERPVTIGADVLIGCQNIILPGVTIGDGAVVGAGSVVTRDVAPHTLVAGNPARFIRALARKGPAGAGCGGATP